MNTPHTMNTTYQIQLLGPGIVKLAALASRRTPSPRPVQFPTTQAHMARHLPTTTADQRWNAYEGVRNYERTMAAPDDRREIRDGITYIIKPESRTASAYDAKAFNALLRGLDSSYLNRKQPPGYPDRRALEHIVKNIQAE